MSDKKDLLKRDALVMANARRLIKLSARMLNGSLYSQLFGTGHGTGRQRARELGLDPDSNKTDYSEMCYYIESQENSNE